MRDKQVRLEIMPEESFGAWTERQVMGYAHDKVRAGNWPSEGSLDRARRDLLALLPQGVKTPHHFLYEARSTLDRALVGYVWLYYDPNSKDRSAFVYDLHVSESVRGHGYGELILRAGEAKVKDMGAQSVKLHVFGYNEAAQKLYLKLGYQITNINMAKPI